MRVVGRVLSLLVMFVAISPAPAHAWWGWLDNLSGPGPFNGAEFDYTILCVMDQPSVIEAAVATTTLRNSLTALKSALPSPPIPPSRRGLVPNASFSESNLFDQRIAKLGEQIDKLTASLGQEQAVTITNQRESESAFVDLQSALNDAVKTFESQNRRGFLAQPMVAALPGVRDLKESVERTGSLWRGTHVPRFSRPAPLLRWWANCADRLEKETASPAGAIRHRDRRPVVAVVLNYRELANRGKFRFWGDARPPSPPADPKQYANGEVIHFRVFEPKLSWPLSGRYDFVNGQAGAGFYRFSSSGFQHGSFYGFVFEPIRFDFHAPGYLIDQISEERTSVVRGLLKAAYSMSFSAGVLMFPGGFPAGRFEGTNGLGGNPLSEGEAVFEMGLVVNVGRLFGR